MLLFHLVILLYIVVSLCSLQAATRVMRNCSRRLFADIYKCTIVLNFLKLHCKNVYCKTRVVCKSYFKLSGTLDSSRPNLSCSWSSPTLPSLKWSKNVEALTLAHIFIGLSLFPLTEQNYIEIPMNRLGRWQLVRKLTQQLWKKWSPEYLNNFLTRSIWHKGKVKEGDSV